MWETVETGTREVGVGEAEGRREKGGSRKKKRRKGEEEETKEGESGRSKENSKRVGNMGRGRGGSKVRSGS